MAIKELITLEGVEDVERSLKQLGTSGEAALAEFRQLGGEGQEPFTPLADAAQKAGQSVSEFGDRSFRLNEIFHILRPALQAAGVQIGEFGSLSRIASAGLTGLAVAAAGAVIVAFARLEESIAATRGRLADLFGSQGAGETAFAQLEAGIKGLGATVGGLVPALEAAKTALDRYIATTRTFKFVSLPGVDLPAGTAQNLKNVGDAVLNFFKILRAGRLDASDAEKADKAFFDTLKEGGTVTAAALKNLPTGTVQLLAEAMGRGQIAAEQFIAEVSLAPIPVTKLIEALARFGPQAQSAFDALAIKGFGDAFNELLKSLQDGFKSISGQKFSGFIIDSLNQITEGIKTTNQEIAVFAGWIKFIEEHTQSDTLGRFVQTIREGITGAGIGGAFGGTADEIARIWDAAGISAADRFVQAFKNAPAAIADILKTGETEIKKAGDTLGDSFKTVPEQAKASFDQIGPALSASLAAIQPPADAIAGSLKERLDAAFADIETSSQAAAATVSAAFMTPIDFTPMFSSFQSALDAILSSAQSVWQQIQGLFSNPIMISAPQFTAPGGAPFASGGLVRGPGSGTSDSILAWLSDKEFVINARAVSHYGPDLFAALNAMRLPRDFLSRFNMGGLVRAITATMPHFASGGMVATAGTAPVTFVIDRQSFDVRASDQTIAKLRRYAIASQLSSAGRKPSWVK